MNWNNTQFDNFEPITLKAARKVGSIFKYMKPTDPFSRGIAFTCKDDKPNSTFAVVTIKTPTSTKLVVIKSHFTVVRHEHPTSPRS